MILLFHLSALIASSAVGVLLMVLGRRHGLPMLTRGGWLLFSLSLFEAGLAGPGPRVAYLLSAAGGLILVAGGPGFLHGVLGLAIPRWLDRVYGGWTGAYLTLAVLGGLPSSSGLEVTGILVLYFGLLAGGLGLAVYRWRTAAALGALSRRFLRRLALVTGICLPWVVLDIVSSLGGWPLPGAWDNLALPVFLLVLAAAVAAELKGWLPPAAPETPDPPAAREPLSPREQQIADRVWEGASSKEIAAELGLSPKTVENHTYRIYQKLGVRSRLQFYRRYR